jgi:hypothetical protein
MTKVWGPLGWMMAHSVSVCYPETPTDNDKRIASEFMEAFGRTITCEICRSHFSTLFQIYKRNVPTWLNSRKDFFLAVCRMHNNVNKRLDKPIPSSVLECLNSLKNATSYTSPSEFRKKYIDYLFRDWNIFGKATSYYFNAMPEVEKMRKINQEYWNLREVSYSDVSFTEDDVLGFANQPTHTPFVFGKLSLKNVRWSPR